MIINYPRKYSDLKRFFHDIPIKIMHNFHQEINTNKMSECPDTWSFESIIISLPDSTFFTPQPPRGLTYPVLLTKVYKSATALSL